MMDTWGMAAGTEAESVDAPEQTGVLPAAGSPPERIGPYQILRELGRGGMGTVYLARRDDGHYAKDVALKLMRAPGRGDLRQRFRVERQILAQLNHPNIAALLDGGETGEGLLYEVIEYVAGVPITRYSREHALGLAERLRLFLRVCDAVEHAHRHLVVHRDIKPENILVSRDGVPKLIDFGIAKILRPDLFVATVHETVPGAFLLTPVYASPEQVRGEPVSTLSDVYSLGVVLYELLTGDLPYPCFQTGASLAEAICHSDPPRPSAACKEPFRKQLVEETDLDTVVLMALRKEPARRYLSVAQMAEDVERYLGGFPVRARPDSYDYRARKFVGRHRAAATMAAASLVLLSAFIGINYQTARRAERERDTALAVAGFLGSVFQGADPVQAGARELTAKDLLDRGSQRIETQLREKPEVQAELMTIMGRTYRHMGDLAQARHLFNRALEIRLAVLGPDHLAVADTLHSLAQLLNATSRYEESEKALRECLRIQRGQLPERTWAVARTRCTLALVLHYRGRNAEAGTMLERTLHDVRLLSRGSIEDADLYDETLNNYSLVLQEQGRFDEAERLRTELMERDRKQYGEVHPHYAMDLGSVGSLLRDRDALDQAEPMLRRSLELHRQLFPQGGPGVVHTMQYLALCLQRMGRLGEAEALWTELRPQRVKLHGVGTRFVASDLAGWGDLLRRKGNLDGAEKAMRESLAIRTRLFGPDHPMTMSSLRGLGRILLERGRFADAEDCFRKSLASTVKLHGDRNPRTTAGVLLDVGEAVWRQGRIAEAEAAFERAYRIRREQLPAGDRQLQHTAEVYGRFLIETGRDAQGRQLLSSR